jgi:outer membrane protein TolC
MQHSVRMYSIALSVGTLAGCATYRPSPMDSAAELRALASVDLNQFTVGRAGPAEHAEVVHGAFDVSDGLDEREVVVVALTLNPELRAKRAETGEARAALITAGLWPNPEVGVSPRWGIGGASGFSIDADALLQLLRPGERDARQQGARAGADEVRGSILADESRLVGEVRAQRVGVLAAQRLVALHHQVIGLRENALDIVRRRDGTRGRTGPP